VSSPGEDKKGLLLLKGGKYEGEDLPGKKERRRGVCLES